ncbi:prolipoprotein diacylglyceryl transferase [Sedimentibacter sp. zth1]|uniref:prolipoprotein diacylglyceryl transferase n=1 Tax=Sedimentibacter sp. zth1 TaxID=2816908 RepID=UPI001A9357BA|nr:prolipoprotein diacylglyceryl transferase [Sedimentibacter sp. zth1]QSX05799.1 prolipoprotein diacylglyceryl transferase [Sedimentibacter sp. zth1]
MCPFINILGFNISAYALCIFIGIGIGTIVAISRNKINYQQKDDIFNAILYGIIGLMIGGKILYLAINFKELLQYLKSFNENLQNLLAMMQGGFVFYSGLIGSIIAIYLYCKRYKINFWNLIDTITPSIPLAHAFGRLGCFCAGCCYGKPYPSPIGMMFNNSNVAPHGITLFPVQLLEATLNLILFIILIIYGRKKRKNGNMICFYLVAYSIIRFILEYFRYDELRGIMFGISTSQWISILIVVVVGLNFIIKHLKNRYRI